MENPNSRSKKQFEIFIFTHRSGIEFAKFAKKIDLQNP